jgi:hypothetical protein
MEHKLLYEIYYTANLGFTSVGWILSLIAYGGIIMLDIKYILPQASIVLITVLLPILAFFTFLIIGKIFMRKGGYKAGQTFGGRDNPVRMNWEFSLANINVQIAQALILKKLAENSNFPTDEIDKALKALIEYRAHVEEMLS